MSEVPRLMSRSSGLIWEHIHPHECISLPISNTGCPDERKKAYFANQFRKTFFTNIYHPFNTTVNTLRKQRCRMIDKSATHLLVILFPTIPYLWNNSLQMRVAKWRWKAVSDVVQSYSRLIIRRSYKKCASVQFMCTWHNASLLIIKCVRA